MKLYKCYIFLMLMALVACETEIPYKGEYTKPMMVLHSNLYTNSNLIVAYPSHSYFFMDTALIYFDPDSRLYDAVVEYKLNNDEWKPIDGTYYPFMTTLDDYQFLPGDSIKLRASHKDYESIESSVEIFPEQIDCSFEYLKQDTDWVYLKVEILPYQNAEPVVLALSASADFQVLEQRMTWHYESREEGVEELVWDYDSIITDTSYYMNTHILSINPVFASVPNNQNMSTGDYTSSLYLYFEPNTITSPTTIEFRIPQYASQYADSEMYRLFSRCQFVECSIRAMTMNSFKCKRSTIQYLHYDPQYRGDDYDLGAYLAELTDFGLQEDIQVFTNITNGLGYLSVESINTKQIQINEENFY